MQMQPKLPSATKVVRKAPVNTLRENCLQSATLTSYTGTLMREPLSSTSELQSIVSGRPGMKTTANNTQHEESTKGRGESKLSELSSVIIKNQQSRLYKQSRRCEITTNFNSKVSVEGKTPEDSIFAGEDLTNPMLTDNSPINFEWSK